MGWAVWDFAIAYFIATLLHIDWGRGSRVLGSRHVHSLPLSLASGIPFALFVTASSRLSGLHKLTENGAGAAELRLIALSVTLAAIALCGLQNLWHVAGQTLEMLVFESLLVGAVMFLSRGLWQWNRVCASRKGTAFRNFVVVGVNQAGREVRDYLTSLQYPGYRFEGFVAMNESPADATPETIDEVVGTIHDLISVARSRFVDEIIFTQRPSTRGVLSQVVRQARLVGIDIRLIPSLSETLSHRNDVQSIGSLPTIAVVQHRRPRFSLLFKRTLDVACASLATVVLSPVFLAISIAIKSQSPGPVFYLSERVGYRGRVFTCYKFRTMVKNAESMRPQFAHLNERRGILFKISNDPRVTSVGAILRKYSLDELPQLFNVIRGDMSLVGPRPSIRSEVAQYDTAHLRRLDVIPGITGLWQVEARQDPSFESYVRLDSKYVDDWSLWLDLKILVRTVGAVIAGTGT
jgi:exopolysaccharide biosynthesis polyprenyl glycosylphosphotransferase